MPFTPVSFKCCSLDRMAWGSAAALSGKHGISVLNKLQSLFSAHSFLLVQFLILVHRITLLSRGAMSGAWDRAQRKGMNPTPHTAF